MDKDRQPVGGFLERRTRNRADGRNVETRDIVAEASQVETARNEIDFARSHERTERNRTVDLPSLSLSLPGSPTGLINISNTGGGRN